MPGNFLWEDLYTASPNAKVILTVRDNDKVWWKSLSSFFVAAAKLWSNPGYYIFNKLKDAQFGGVKQTKWQIIENFCINKFAMPGLDQTKRFYTWQGYAEYVKAHEKISRQSYRKHNAYVKV